MTDSQKETMLHIGRVRELMLVAMANLAERAVVHDASKLLSPEAEAFEEFTPKLRATTYGSVEYERLREGLGPALEHHYAHNRHHPEFHPDGVHGMTLLDLLEMLLDWKAATERHADGDIRKSVEHNSRRFGYSSELKRIFLNTLDEFGL